MLAVFYYNTVLGNPKFVDKNYIIYINRKKIVPCISTLLQLIYTFTLLGNLMLENLNYKHVKNTLGNLFTITFT